MPIDMALGHASIKASVYTPASLRFHGRALAEALRCCTIADELNIHFYCLTP